MPTPFHHPTIDDIIDDNPLSTAEKALLAACKTGVMPVLGPDRPEVASDANNIRGDLIRYLLLGGCEAHRPHPKGGGGEGCVHQRGAGFSGLQKRPVAGCLRQPI